MPLQNFEKNWIETRRHLRKLEQKFLSTHMQAPLATPADYELDVRAFCVLAHAAFEQYIEDLATTVFGAIYDGWLKRKYNISTICAIAFFGQASALEAADDETTATGHFTRIRLLLDSLRDPHSKAVHGNHGIAVKYLRNLLYPVALDFGDDANLLNSLVQLAKGRGDYAHNLQAKVILSPPDARTYVRDVERLWRRMVRQARKRLAELQ